MTGIALLFMEKSPSYASYSSHGKLMYADSHCSQGHLHHHASHWRQERRQQRWSKRELAWPPNAIGHQRAVVMMVLGCASVCIICCTTCRVNLGMKDTTTGKDVLQPLAGISLVLQTYCWMRACVWSSRLDQP